MSPSPTPDSTIALLGPRGTYTEQALLSQPDLAAAEHHFCTSMPEVLRRVEDGEFDFAFVAIENSIEGTVSATIDTLAFASQLLIQREVDMPIRLSLFTPAGGSIDNIKEVRSHPHALGQVRQWLDEHLPGVHVVAATSTAAAIEETAATGDPACAAIGNRLAGEIYGLTPVATDIEDHTGNVTRFVLVSREGVHPPTGHDKTSIVVFQRSDRPGSLLLILQEFAARSINLVKLESRPTKQGLGDYCFIIDFMGHLGDEIVADALRSIYARNARVSFLGSYPALGDEVENIRQDANSAWLEADAWLTKIRRHL